MCSGSVQKRLVKLLVHSFLSMKHMYKMYTAQIHFIINSSEVNEHKIELKLLFLSNFKV